MFVVIKLNLTGMTIIFFYIRMFCFIDYMISINSFSLNKNFFDITILILNAVSFTEVAVDL